MKKMSHLVRALALAALIASLLAACSGSGSKADLPSPDTNAPNTAEPPAPQDTGPRSPSM